MGKLKAAWVRWRAWRLARHRQRSYIVDDNDFAVNPAMFSSATSYTSESGSAAAPLFAGAGGTFDGGGASGDWSDSSSDSGSSDSGSSDSGGSDGGGSSD